MVERQSQPNGKSHWQSLDQRDCPAEFAAKARDEFREPLDAQRLLFTPDGRKVYVGNNYEEKGRLFLAVRGQLTHVVGGRPPIVLSSTGDADGLAAALTDDWNSVHLIVRGNVLTHIVNGRIMTVVIDDDVPNRPVEGLIGVQVHVGPPMKVEYRNIRLKNW